MNYKVTVLGLGAMGLPMAARLATQLTVHGFDIAEPRLKLAEDAGIKTFSDTIIGNLAGNSNTVFGYAQGDFDFRYVGDVRWGAAAAITVDTATAPGYNRWKAPPGCSLVDIFQSTASQMIDFPAARPLQRFSHFTGTWVTVSEV